MKSILVTIILVLSLPSLSVSAKTNAEIKQEIIKQSIRSYPGRCPCPYNVTSNGSRCGKRSAWSKPGGYSPICYEREVTHEMISRWKRSH
ncbi:hypothetical protein ETN89_15060 [Photobacterium damselae subsp. damselae]|uniref:Uncharacterized protein n=1 Tax=Photobacterium damselae TaxID=38293 RepID=A0A2T3QL79_PHODM|nr:hypothetical protein CAY62_19520 [Photobacterium damselae subsp. damselae]AWK83841.1 hypothetical protein BST98_17700 [Photobacterium damselae]KAB1181732.1 hypothetical protein F6477_04120 [Photobacterium damselae subsp. damselae]PSW85809.1 hypothetical protein CTN07_07890 [Photobacterium damselae]QAY36640.1 hypothetical protein ETN89_15060 [Photobacterium damselae subsp. damselae]